MLIMDTKKIATRFVLDYGFPTQLNGFYYIRDCFIITLENEFAPANKILFNELGDKYNTDPDNIERCIGVVVNKMWETLQAVGMFSSKPTIREFITTCAEHIMIDSGRPKSAYDVLLKPDYD